MNDLMMQPGPITVQPVNAFEMRPRTLDEAMKFAEIMANSDLVPNGYKGKPGNILVACQMGHELGLTPMRALRCIAVINGRASMWGDEMLAMVLAAPVCEYVDESQSNDQQGVCRVKRKTDPKEHVSIFTLEDAKRAGLLGKQGPWQSSTKRMLQLRARGFALRDKFADVLAGLVTTEEALDIPATEPLMRSEEQEKPATLKDRLKHKVEATVEAKPDDGLSERPVGPARAHDLADQQSQDAPAPAFVWRLGKHKGESIATVPDDYLDWFMKNGKVQDHVDQARMELDRRNAQASFAEEGAE